VIDFAAIKAEIAAFMPALSGVPASRVIWRDEAAGSKYIPGDTAILMRLQNTTRMGIEEEFYTAGSAPGADQVATVSGQRQFTWNIRAESFEQDIASPKFAGNILDTLCLRLMRATAIWSRTTFGIVHRTPTQFFSYKDSGRQVSCYVLDILCSTKETEQDTSTGAGDWIGAVHVVGDVDGNEQVNEVIDAR